MNIGSLYTIMIRRNSECTSSIASFDMITVSCLNSTTFYISETKRADISATIVEQEYDSMYGDRLAGMLQGKLSEILLWLLILLRLRRKRMIE